MKDRGNLKPHYLMGAINMALLTVTAFAGLFIPGTYEDFVEPLHLAESQGQDLTTLCVGLPLLIIAMVLTRRGSVRGPILWAGALGYFLYINLIYAYGGVYNVLFFGYVAICGLSLFSMTGILLRIDAHRVAQHVKPGMPSKSIALFLAGTAVLLTFMWGGMAAASISAGETADANVIIVTDFMVIIPAFVLSAIWLWRCRPWGYVLTGVLFVQAVTLGVSIVAGQVIALVKGAEPVWGLAVFFLVFTLIGSVLAIFYNKNMSNRRQTWA